jgi:integrase
MPLKLIPPKPGRSPSYYVRGTYLGTHVNRSVGTGDRKVAARILGKWKEEIERGAYSRPDDPTFASAALGYMQAGGERRYVAPLLNHFGEAMLATIGQAEIDAAAIALYPNASAQTRNRQVYTPMSAILKRAGIEKPVHRPKGWRGKPRAHWLTEDQAFALLAAATARHKRFGALLTFLLYTGVRLNEALSLTPRDVELQRSFAHIGRTKNGEPQAVHLPPVVVAALAELDLTGRSVFRFAKSGRIYNLLKMAEADSGVTIPDGVGFHIFRHTFGAWLRRAGADLTRVGRWKDPASTRVYDHVQVDEEARKADLLPVRKVRTQ